MDKDLKTLIDETLNETFKDSPEKMENRNVDEIYRDACLICKKQINEHEEYTEDGGVTWRHSDCKSVISRPETPLEQINRGLQPYVAEAREQRRKARQAMGMEAVERGFTPDDKTLAEPDLPLTGDEKYCEDNKKQQAPFPINTTGLGESGKATEQDETHPIAVQSHEKFMGGAVLVANTTPIPIVVAISEFTSNVGDAVAKSYIIHIQDGGPSK